ncbi:1-acyl-sn-glycerol-3-phosphate acyltransferase [Humibacter sp. RRB41]|uniref:lysophospholipid acyltransferase family protein n=1 Tax=Humibacter sp. RRB41 TaxID=2919946 RepID=UPI001FA9A904|nr:lysophospholipid acyltransferase family protein [Humibacter sp. RRB41]
MTSTSRVLAPHTPVQTQRQQIDTPTPRIGFLYGFGRFVVAPFARAMYRPRVLGRQNVPKSGAVILASNHLSFIDSVVIPVVAPRPVQFLAKSHYFEGHGISGWVKRVFFTAIGAVGVKRGAGRDSQDALELSRDILEAGNAFALYPEGTRSRDGRLYRGRTGVAWLALTTGVPVVPVGLIGTERLQPVGKNLPKFARVTVAFGTPIDVSSFGPATSGRARREATDAIMAEIQRLSGQVEAGVYNEGPAE